MLDSPVEVLLVDVLVDGRLVCVVDGLIEVDKLDMQVVVQDK